MSDQAKEKPAPPEIGPYVLPVVLAFMGFWCLKDGWFTSNTEMLEHQTFNRVASIVLLVWAGIDWFRTWRAEKKYKIESERGTADDSSK